MSSFFKPGLFRTSSEDVVTGVSSVNGRDGDVVLTKNDVGLGDYDDTVQALQSGVAKNASDIADIDAEIEAINTAIDGVATKASIDSAVAAHNTDNQSHNDIRNQIVDINNSLSNKAEQGEVTGIDFRLNSVVNTLATKADKVTISEGQEEVGKVSFVDENGNFQPSTVSATDLASLKTNAALKNEKNTFTERNTFNKNIIINVDNTETSDESGIVFAANNAIISDTNGKVLLQDKISVENVQSTYLGGNSVEIYAPDGVSMQTTGQVKVVRGNYTDGWNTYENVDSGNITEFLPESAGVTLREW